MSGEDADPLIGRTLDGRYALDERIGRGGMGDVYRGRHLMMSSRVAVKVLRPVVAADPTATQRFTREARGAFKLDHPNSVRVFDFGFDNAAGVMYLVMEYVDGRTVADELAVDGPLSGERACHVAGQVCSVLEQAHGIGLVHRDLKPENLMLIRRGDDPDFVKVLDFGLAKLYEPDSAGTTMFSLAAVTQDGTVFGTPEYMSPEQATGQQLDPRSDVYSLGVVLYEMVTGLLPFQGNSFMATLSAHVRQTAEAPGARRPDLNIAPALDALILRCMAKKPDERPASATALKYELAQLATRLRDRPSRLPAALASSDTLELSRVQMQAHGTSPTSAPGKATRDLLPGRGRGFWLAVTGAVLAVAGVAAAIALTGGSSAHGVAGAAATGDARVGAALVADAGAAATANTPPDAAPPDAASAPDAPPRRNRPRATSRRQKIAAAVAAHLAAADSARRAGNTLREIAHLDAALKLDSHDQEAAYRLGDALLRSGDEVRGCRYLARARRLRKARDRAAAAGCTH